MQRFVLPVLSILLWPMVLMADMVVPLVKVESKLYVRMIFLDYNYSEKLVNGNVEIVVLYDTPEHQAIAKLFIENISSKRMLGKKVKVRPLLLEYWAQQPVPTAYIVVLQKSNLQKIAKTLLEKNRLVFVYDEADIPYGMVGIRLGASIAPVVNIKNLIEAGINLRPVVFQVAKVYDGRD